MTTPLYFDSFTTAIETYPDDNVELEIVDVSFPGSALNEHEVGNFNVRVTNNGPVTLKDVQLKITGLNGTLVGGTGSPASLVTSFTTDKGDLDDVVEGHSKKLPLTVIGIAPLSFKAPGASALEELIEITLDNWYPDFEHIYTDHTTASTKVSATFSHKVVKL
jgi:hypothetical protein